MIRETSLWLTKPELVRLDFNFVSVVLRDGIQLESLPFHLIRGGILQAAAWGLFSSMQLHLVLHSINAIITSC